MSAALAIAMGWQCMVGLRAHAADATRDLNRILSDPDLKKVVVGISVVDVNTGKTVFAKNADRLFSPASNMKLVTTAAAVHILGLDYTFRTSVYRNGKVQGGVLQGDLIVRGSGDPNISGRFYGENITAIPDTWANAIREQGIQTVTGDLIADDTIFDREYVSPYWPNNQLWKWYCAPICGLSFNDNCVEVEIRPGEAAEKPALVSCIPPTSYIAFGNECTTTERKRSDCLVIDRRPGEATITVGGACWMEAEPRKYFVTVDNPALFLTTVFKESLSKAGVTVKGKPRMIAEPLAEVETPANEVAACEHDLRKTIDVTNKRSQNFYAEQLLKLIGHKARGTGSRAAGIAAVAGFLKESGIAPGSYTLADGCGLASENRMTPAQFTTLLRTMWSHRYNNAYVNSLAKPGEDGSLRSRFKDKRYQSRICGKTGYISGVSALSGYLSTNSGRVYAYSILMNDPGLGGLEVSARDLREVQDKICTTLIDS